MGFLPEAARTIGSFVVVLGVLVFIHEMGHYLAARWRGIHVEAFLHWLRPAIRAMDGPAWEPIGGYAGSRSAATSSCMVRSARRTCRKRVRDAWIPGRTFHEKPVLSRAIVVAAGPIANFLLAVVLFSIMFGVQGEPGDPVVETVIPHSAAEAAGFRDGDRIASINDRKINTFEDIVRVVSVSPDTPLHVGIVRDAQAQILDVTPEAKDDGGGGKLGVLGIAGALRPVGLVGAVVDGVRHTWDVAVQTLAGVWQIITGQRGAAGPRRTAQDRAALGAGGAARHR